MTTKITQEQLVEKFPLIFKKLKYLQCDDGWIPLLYEACSIIEYYLANSVPEEIRHGIYAVQIKEKFGTARIYFNETTPFIDGVIAMTEHLTAHTCERCSMPGHRCPGTWIKTFCDDCFKIFSERKKVKNE
jgi:hypothetical protein